MVTTPLPESTETPRCDLRAKLAMASQMSAPEAISSTWDRSELGLSRVIMTGGLGLFLDPGGRPRGLRLAAVVVGVVSSAVSRFVSDSELVFGLLPLLLVVAVVLGS